MNKKQVVKLLVVIFTSLLFSSCIAEWFGVAGKGSVVTQEVKVTDFQTVELLTAADVDIVKGDTFKVIISDYENIIKYLSVKVVDQKLLISISPISTLLINSKAKVTISMPDTLKSVTIAGSGNVNINSAFKDLNSLVLTGSGNINANQDLNVTALNASILGSGNIIAKGNTQALTGLISGSGNLLFANLTATNATCTISGSGNISVHAVNTLKANITGSGNIYYTGTPTVDSSISGSGRVLHN